MTTLSDALIAYRVCAKAEGKSPRTIEWVTSSVGYFWEFLGNNPDIVDVTADNLRRFILACQDRCKFSNHPFARPQTQKLSPHSVETYARAIRAFFSYLHGEGLIESNPMDKVKMPKVPTKVVPTFSEKELERLLAQPDKRTDVGMKMQPALERALRRKDILRA